MNNPDNLQLALTLIPLELWNTLYMVAVSACIAVLFGVPAGIVLCITDKGGLKEQALVHQSLGAIANVGRSFPFAILMVALIPFTRWIIGTSLGTTAAIVPLSVAAIPFVARIAEAAFKEIEKSLIETAVVIGSSTRQIIMKVMIPESLPALIQGITMTIINLIGYSTMAGTMGGGGLGKIAIQYGYQRFNVFLMVATVLLLIILVQGIQWAGNSLARKIHQQRGKSLNK